MNTPATEPSQPAATHTEVAAIPVTKWWARYAWEGNPPQRRLMIRWPRIFLAAACLLLICYLGLATALWGYYTFYLKFEGVSWTDTVTIRLARVQSAIGAHHYKKAKELWEKRDFVQSIQTARAAVRKAPSNLEARIFLAQSWQQASRYDEAVRVLRDGIAFNASDPMLHKALVETCLTTGRHTELLQILRESLPARGVRLLDGNNRSFELAEVRAVLETAGPSEAEKVIATHPGFALLPVAAPLMARVDWELGKRDNAIKRLSEARERAPNDIGVHDAYVEMSIRLGRSVEAREAAAAFLKMHPNLPMAQLRFLEAHDSRQGADRTVWMNECLRYLAQYRQVPGALERLASLAALRGWSDLAYMLYQNALQENLNGFPFAIYYAASLVKTGEFLRADAVWRELATRNSAQLASGTYIAAMIAWSVGNKSEATQILERLHRETTNEPRRRQSLLQIFRDFGFPQLADEFEQIS